MGYPHPDFWLDSITSEQLLEWEAYDRLEPIGGYRQDYRFAQICHLIYEISQAVYGKKGKRRRSTPKDFMPWGPEEKETPKRKQSPEEIKERLLLAFKPKRR